MIRGTTPTHYFEVPLDGESIDKVNILYGQDDKLLFKKKTSDCIIDGSKISTKLTREETLLFDHKKPAQVQSVGVLRNGDVFESVIKTFGVDQLLDDGEIE